MENCAQSPQQDPELLIIDNFDFDSIFDEEPGAPPKEGDYGLVINVDSTLQELYFTPAEHDLTPLENDDFLVDIDFTPQDLKGSDSPKSMLSYEEIERMLMEDVDDDVYGTVNQRLIDGFVEGILVDVSGSESGTGNCEAATTPDSVGEGEGEKRREDDGEEEDDLVSKKKRRQLRNRESAMMSRERKKIYVKELEMKSKYLESECRRLDYALRCCVAENQVLHQRLQMGGPLGVYAAKQESAVLFMESLLLGSLFWLLSIVCLSLVPGMQMLNQKEGNRLGRGLALEAVRSKILANNKNIGSELEYELFIMGRRCRGTKHRMKLYMTPRPVLCA
ncbi:bZIP transcription factor 50 [Iris pallida]|uniref:BZIP transcription factor 50 n=1 Tax=Iris pallida TaxID=29817 RepID=A0AAX6H5F5_IRIPA|nr:bZIP transcription factor 50 [Iris pallida]